MQLYSGLTSDLDIEIDGIFNENIIAIGFDGLGENLFVAGDRQVRVFVNVTGYKVGIILAKEKLKDGKISSATRERLESQIDEFEVIVNQYQ